VVLATSLGLLGAPAPVAAVDPAAGPERKVPWPPQDTDGAWRPVPAEAYETFTVPACGSTVVVSAGDVREQEYRATQIQGGETLVEVRGGLTSDLSRESDAAQIDELVNSGAVEAIVSADGLTETYSYAGPSLLGSFDAVEATAFTAHGLPALSYYEQGQITERVVRSRDEDAETIVSADILTDTAEGKADVCTLLDNTDDD
jgi:hypothetical protein